MKHPEQKRVESLPRPSEQPISAQEKTREAIARTQQTLQKADRLLEAQAPRTAAERMLSASRSQVMNWLKRTALLGALTAAGYNGMSQGAEHLGDAAHEAAVSVGHAIGGLNEMRPSRVEDETPATIPTETHQEIAPQIQEETPTTGTTLPQMEIAIDDPGVTPDADVAEVHDATMSDMDRQEHIESESAQLIVDQLQQEHFFNQVHSPSELRHAITERLHALRISGDRAVEQTVGIIRQQLRETVQERAQTDVDGAFRMARNMQQIGGVVDPYAFALEHNRPDLAAETVTDTVSSYRENVDAIHADTDYENEDERTEAIQTEQQSLIRDVFSGTHQEAIPEVLGHLTSAERETLATALNANITDPDLASDAETNRQRLALLQSSH